MTNSCFLSKNIIKSKLDQESQKRVLLEMKKPFWNFISLHKKPKKNDTIYFNIQAFSNSRVANFVTKLNKEMKGRMTQKVLEVSKKSVRISLEFINFINYAPSKLYWEYKSNFNGKIIDAKFFNGKTELSLPIAQKGDERYVIPKEVKIGNEFYKIAMPIFPDADIQKATTTKVNYQTKKIQNKKLKYLDLILNINNNKLGEIEYNIHAVKGVLFYGVIYCKIKTEKTGTIIYSIDESFSIN